MTPLLASVLGPLARVLPGTAEKALLKGAWSLQGRPRTYTDPAGFPAGMPERGSVTFSLDFELAWAWRFSKRSADQAAALGLRERRQLPAILEAFDRRTMPATWATVGHLFLSSCDRAPDGRAHPEIPAVAPFESRWWRFDGPDWFGQDPATDVSRDPAWYAPDLIDLIRKSPAGHEIACHSFSHMGFGPYCPHETALAELRACRQIMEARGIDARTFVHPGNDFGNFAALKEAGFTIFRLFPWETAEISLPVRRPDGLWMVPAAACLQAGDETNPRALRLHRHRLELLVDAAVTARLNAHLWLHPSILPEQSEHVLYPLLDYCARLRDAGKLDVLTMRDLVARMEAVRV